MQLDETRTSDLLITSPTLYHVFVTSLHSSGFVALVPAFVIGSTFWPVSCLPRGASRAQKCVKVWGTAPPCHVVPAPLAALLRTALDKPLMLIWLCHYEGNTVGLAPNWPCVSRLCGYITCGLKVSRQEREHQST